MTGDKESSEITHSNVQLLLEAVKGGHMLYIRLVPAPRPSRGRPDTSEMAGARSGLFLREVIVFVDPGALNHTPV